MGESTTKPLPGDKATQLDVAYRALDFRTELDALLKKHGVRMLLGWEGKWAKLQLMFPEASTEIVLTIIETKKGGRVRYRLDEEES